MCRSMSRGASVGARGCVWVRGVFASVIESVDIVMYEYETWTVLDWNGGAGPTCPFPTSQAASGGIVSCQDRFTSNSLARHANGFGGTSRSTAMDVAGGLGPRELALTRHVPVVAMVDCMRMLKDQSLTHYPLQVLPPSAPVRVLSHPPSPPSYHTLVILGQP